MTATYTGLELVLYQGQDTSRPCGRLAKCRGCPGAPPAIKSFGGLEFLEIVAALGGLFAWLTIRSDVLHEEPEKGGEAPAGLPERVEIYSCSVDGSPLRTSVERES